MRSKGYSILHDDCQQLTIKSVAAKNVKFFTDNGGNLNEVKLDELWFGVDSNGENSWKFKLRPDSNRKDKEISIEESGGDLSLCTVFRSILRNKLPSEEFNNNVTLWIKQKSGNFHVSLVYHTPLSERSNEKGFPPTANVVLLPIKTYVEMRKLGYDITDELDCDVIENTYKLEDVTLIHAGDDPLKEMKLSEVRETKRGQDATLVGYHLKTKDDNLGEEKSTVYLPGDEPPKSICSLAHWLFTNEFNSASRFDDFTAWKKPESENEIALLYYKPQRSKRLIETPKETPERTAKETANGLTTRSKPELNRTPFNKWQAVGGATLVPALTLGYYLHRRARKARPNNKKTRENALKT
jgi:hypothetical protein